MAEWKKVETGTDETGEPTHEYQFGAEIEGVFVPAVTKSASYVEHLHERAAAAQKNAEAQTETSEPDGSES